MNKDGSFEITTRLRYMITSVDGNRDVSAITKYINGMLARDSKSFREYVRSISPDMDMTFEYTHDNGEVEALPITMGVNFFWPSE